MPIGIYGTLPHILTNKDVKNKKEAIKDVTKEAVKGSGKLLLANGAVLGAGAGATYAVNKFCPEIARDIKNSLSSLGSKIVNTLSKVKVKIGTDVVKLKDIFKDPNFSELANSIKSIPAPIKGAIAAGAVILPFVAGYIFDKTRGNMAAAEAKQETKQV